MRTEIDAHGRCGNRAARPRGRRPPGSGDTDTLFVRGNDDEALVERDRQGPQTDVTTLTGLDDAGRLSAIGGGRFVIIAGARLPALFLLSQVAGGGTAPRVVRPASSGETAGTAGVTNDSFESVSGSFFAVRERLPPEAFGVEADFAATSAAVSERFVPAPGMLGPPDVRSRSTAIPLAGTPDAANVPVFGQPSARLVPVRCPDDVVGSFDFAGIAADAEGVTTGGNDVVRPIGETPGLRVPTPGTGALGGRSRTRAARARHASRAPPAPASPHAGVWPVASRRSVVRRQLAGPGDRRARETVPDDCHRGTGAGQDLRRTADAPRMPRPAIIVAQVAGSGTGAALMTSVGPAKLPFV